MTPVRLNPDGDAEVVWGRRIDPVRLRIENIPYPSSGFRAGDIVLHDGAAVGKRVWQGRDYNVFNVLQLHAPSPMTTFELAVEAESSVEVAALGAAIEEAGCKVEDWSMVRILCKACSEGAPHEHHDKEGGEDESWVSQRLLGAAAKDEAILRMALARWEGPGRRVISLDAALTPPASN